VYHGRIVLFCVSPVSSSSQLLIGWEEEEVLVAFLSFIVLFFKVILEEAIALELDFRGIDDMPKNVIM